MYNVVEKLRSRELPTRTADLGRMGQFRGARRADVEKHLETLKVLGVVAETGEGRYQAVGGGVAVA